MDLAKMELLETFEYPFDPGRKAQAERSINALLQQGWVTVTSKIIQCGSERTSFYAQHCVVLGKPKERSPQTDLKDVGEVFIEKCTVGEATTNIINRYIEEGWVLQKLQPSVERETRDGEPYEHTYILLVMLKPRRHTIAEKLEERKKKSYPKKRP